MSAPLPSKMAALVASLDVEEVVPPLTEAAVEQPLKMPQPLTYTAVSVAEEMVSPTSEHDAIDCVLMLA